MKETGVEKVKNVWDRKNKINNPNSKENILEIINKYASLFTAGATYNFLFNFDTLEMQYVSPNIKDVLGIEANTFNLNTLFEKLLHPEDVEKFHEKENVGFDFLMNHIKTDDIPLYKVVYLMRLKHSNGEYITILHQSRTLTLSKEGKVQQIFCVQSDITHLNIPMDHKMSFISIERPSYYAIETTPPYVFKENKFRELFTNREQQVLKEVSKGKSFDEIAKTLSVSTHTVSTHKRNILKKSNCKNTAELITRCIREGVI